MGHDLGSASGVDAAPDLRRRAVYTTAPLALDDEKGPELAARRSLRPLPGNFRRLAGTINRI
ncbi:hypothetical protein SAMN05421504_111103 [Amycolatopsis xylanica]|uniref:Uncharacterized protein n=1 Tax=Amycolatopsis xylanica TaxID=589385 RepID=A0A1H3RI06_9PSEU|nr:hypothetical protein SAMN05421504_111103 [Amycolatopsis xylanica]